MKMSIWNLLTILLLIGTFGMVVVFGAVFILPNQLLPIGMRPINIPPTLVLPTATETPFQFPPTWTKVPPLPTDTNTPLPTATPTLTNTPLPTNTIYVTPSTTLTPSKTPTYTRTATNTKNPIFVSTGASKTATKTKTKAPTKTATTCPVGVCGIDAIDDRVDPIPFPAFIDINVIANDTLHNIPVKIPRLFGCANQCETDKWGNYTTKKGGKVSIITKEYSTIDGVIRYTPPVGFMGMDSIDYKITTIDGTVDIATVTFIVSDGTQGPPTNITTAPDPMTLLENVSAGTSVGTLSTTDPLGGGPWIYSLVSGAGNTNNSYFSLSSGGNLTTSATVNCEVYPTLSLRVRTTDPIGFFYEKALSVTVVNVNEFAPVITSSTAVTANAGVAFTYNVSSSDADCHDTRTITQTGLPAELTLGPTNASGIATITGTPVVGVYTVNLTVTDAGLLTGTKTLTITIIP
jgi:hypothetical protein